MQARTVAILVVSLFAGASAPVPFHAELSPEQDKSAQDQSSQRFVLDAGVHMLTDILDRASKFLGRNYFYQKPELGNEANSIVIHQKLDLDAKGCEEVVSQLAYLKGFAIVPIDPRRRLYDVISMRGQRSEEISLGAVAMSPEEVLEKSGMKLMVLTTVPLKHIDAAKAAQQLRPFFTSGGGRNGISFGNAGSPTSVLLKGYSSHVAAAIRVLREVDRPEESKLPSGFGERLAELSSWTARQTNEIEAMRKRLATLESQLATLASDTKKK